MADARKRMDPGKVCGNCGSVGFRDNLITCSRCSKASEHILVVHCSTQLQEEQCGCCFCLIDNAATVGYCMLVLAENLEVWCCEKCQSTAADICDTVQNVCKGKKPMLHKNENLRTDVPLVPLTTLADSTKNLPYHCTSEACWKGTFEVSLGTGCYENYGGFEAFLDKRVSAKVSEFSRYLPRNLELNTLSRKDVWPRAFQLDPPNHEDIGLYFFPNKIERSKEVYSHLVKKIDLCDFAMRFLIGKVELIIYSSSQLTVDCQRTYENNYYLWGFFRHIRPRKHYQHNLESSLCSPADLKKNGCCQAFVAVENKAEEEIDMIGGKEVGQTNITLPLVDAPPGFPRAVLSPPSQKNTPTNVSFKTNIQTNGDVPPGNSSISELSRISSQDGRTQAQDHSNKDDKIVSDNTDVLPKLCQVTSSCNANLESSRSTHAALVKSNGLCPPENHTYEKVQLIGKKLHHTPRSPFSSSISYDQGLHESIVRSDKSSGAPYTDAEVSKKKSISKMYKEAAQSFVDHSNIEVLNEDVDQNENISPIDPPPGFTSRIYSHSSHAKISTMNCLKTRSLVAKDVPPEFSEAPDSKDIFRLQGEFEDFHPKAILSPNLDVPPGFTSKDRIHSSCTERSPVKCFFKTKSPLKRDVPPGFVGTSNLNDIVTPQGVKFEAQECHITESEATIDAFGKPHQGSATQHTNHYDGHEELPEKEVVPTIADELTEDEVQEDDGVIKPIIHAEDDVPVDAVGRQHIGDLTPHGFVRATVTREVTNAFGHEYNHPWLYWRCVPIEVKEKAWVYFKQQNLFFWEPNLEDSVRDCFMMSLQTRLKRMFCQARRRAIELARNKDLNEAKKYPPWWIKQEVWEQLCDVWLQPDWQAKSKKNSENRSRRPRDGGIVTHTGGIVTHKLEAHKKRLAKEKGREPDLLELFDKMNKRKKTGEYCYKKSKATTVESFKAKLSHSQLQPKVEGNSQGSTNMAASDLKAAWISASGGVNKNQVHGFANHRSFERGECSTEPTPTQAPPGAAGDSADASVDK